MRHLPMLHQKNPSWLNPNYLHSRVWLNCQTIERNNSQAACTADKSSMVSDVGKVSWSTQIIGSMRVVGSTIKEKVRDLNGIIMGTHTLVISKMVFPRAKEFTIGTMGRYLTVNGKMASSMGMESGALWIMSLILASGKNPKLMDTAYTLGPTGINMKAHGSKD